MILAALTGARFWRRAAGIVAIAVALGLIWGPAMAISDMVTCAARNAADQLVDAMQRDLLVDGGDGPALIEAAGVAAAWAETYVALRAVEAYSFDPDDDHVRP